MLIILTMKKTCYTNSSYLHDIVGTWTFLKCSRWCEITINTNKSYYVNIKNYIKIKCRNMDIIYYVIISDYSYIFNNIL